MELGRAHRLLRQRFQELYQFRFFFVQQRRSVTRIPKDPLSMPKDEERRGGGTNEIGAPAKRDLAVKAVLTPRDTDLEPGLGPVLFRHATGNLNAAGKDAINNVLRALARARIANRK
jgi:hypothetical protein